MSDLGERDVHKRNFCGQKLIMRFGESRLQINGTPLERGGGHVKDIGCEINVKSTGVGHFRFLVLIWEVVMRFWGNDLWGLFKWVVLLLKEVLCDLKVLFISMSSTRFSLFILKI